MYDLVEAMNNLEAETNDLKSFKTYIENEMANPDSKLSEALSGVQYSYNIRLMIYTKNVDGSIIPSDTQALLQELVSEFMGMDMTALVNMRDSMFGLSESQAASFGTGVLWQEMLPGDNGAPVSELLQKQYVVIYGSWPNSYDEIVLVLDENNEIYDVTMYALGL